MLWRIYSYLLAHLRDWGPTGLPEVLGSNACPAPSAHLQDIFCMAIAIDYNQKKELLCSGLCICFLQLYLIVVWLFGSVPPFWICRARVYDKILATNHHGNHRMIYTRSLIPALRAVGSISIPLWIFPPTSWCFTCNHAPLRNDSKNNVPLRQVNMDKANTGLCATQIGHQNHRRI